MEAKDQGSLFESEIPENASEILNLQEAAFWFNVSKANNGKRDNASSQNSTLVEKSKDEISDEPPEKKLKSDEFVTPQSSSSFDFFDSVLKKPGPQKMFHCTANTCKKTFTNAIDSKRCLEAHKFLASQPPTTKTDDCRNKTSEVSAVVSEQVSKVVSKQGPLRDTPTFGHSKSSPTTLSKSPKGHLISKCPFDVYKPKTKKIFARISALASKKRSSINSFLNN